jgi:hypothetical protein
MKLTLVSACVFAVATSLAGCMGTGDVEYAQARHPSGQTVEARNTVQPRRTQQPPPTSQSTYPSNAKPSPDPHDWTAPSTLPGNSPPAETPYVPNTAPSRATRSRDVQDQPMRPDNSDEARDRRIDEKKDKTRSDE